MKTWSVSIAAAGLMLSVTGAYAGPVPHELFTDALIEGCIPAMAALRPFSVYAENVRLETAPPDQARGMLRGEPGKVFFRTGATAPLIVLDRADSCMLITKGMPDVSGLTAMIETALKKVDASYARNSRGQMRMGVETDYTVHVGKKSVLLMLMTNEDPELSPQVSVHVSAEDEEKP